MNKRSASAISANAAYLILLAQYTKELTPEGYTSNSIKTKTEFRMALMRKYRDSKLLDNGDKIIYQGGRWYYSSYNF